MLVSMLKIEPSPSNRRELLDILHNVAGPTSSRPGCQACEIYEGAFDSQTVLYIEQWDSLANLSLHIRSPLYARILMAMDLATSRPELKFIDSSGTYGMDLVESLRGPNPAAPGRAAQAPAE